MSFGVAVWCGLDPERLPRVKGPEKFWRNDHANAILQLRADSLSDSQPLDKFWIRWRANLTGANQDRTTVL